MPDYIREHTEKVEGKYAKVIVHKVLYRGVSDLWKAKKPVTEADFSKMLMADMKRERKGIRRVRDWNGYVTNGWNFIPKVERIRNE